MSLSEVECDDKHCFIHAIDVLVLTFANFEVTCFCSNCFFIGSLFFLINCQFFDKNLSIFIYYFTNFKGFFFQLYS